MVCDVATPSLVVVTTVTPVGTTVIRQPNKAHVRTVTSVMLTPSATVVVCVAVGSRWIKLEEPAGEVDTVACHDDCVGNVGSSVLVVSVNSLPVVGTVEGVLLGYGTVTVDVTVSVVSASTTRVVVVVVTRARLATLTTGSPPGYTLTQTVSVCVSYRVENAVVVTVLLTNPENSRRGGLRETGG